MKPEPKEKTKQFATWRGELSLHSRVQSIVDATKASYTDVMRNLLKRGLDDYEGENNDN